jgi:hypothetical protein
LNKKYKDLNENYKILIAKNDLLYNEDKIIDEMTTTQNHDLKPSTN